MKRSNGRNDAEDVRECAFELDVLQDADGSARLGAGKAQVLASVVGPVAVKARQEKTDRATIQVSVETLSSPPSVFQTAMADCLKGLIEQIILAKMHPRTLISISIQPISTDGSSLAQALNACTAALISAAIPLRTTLLAVSGAIMADGQILWDPAAQEESQATAQFTYVFDLQKEEAPFYFESSGSLDAGLLKSQLAQKAFSVVKRIGEVLRRRAVKDRLAYYQ